MSDQDKIPQPHVSVPVDVYNNLVTEVNNYKQLFEKSLENKLIERCHWDHVYGYGRSYIMVGDDAVNGINKFLQQAREELHDAEETSHLCLDVINELFVKHDMPKLPYYVNHKFLSSAIELLKKKMGKKSILKKLFKP